jgi:hypothetical protein
MGAGEGDHVEVWIEFDWLAVLGDVGLRPLHPGGAGCRGLPIVAQDVSENLVDVGGGERFGAWGSSCGSGSVDGLLDLAVGRDLRPLLDDGIVELRVDSVQLE